MNKACHPMAPLKLALAAAMCGVGLVRADEVASSYQETPAEENQLEAVTVTARRRSESADKVPISVTAVQGGDLAVDATPAAGNAGLARAVPNLSFADIGATNANVFSIRGVGSFMPLSADDTSVVLYVDDVPRATTGAPPTLMDVARVEVLRGPQGTLFGRNTQGGAINVITNPPDFRRGFSATSEAGTHGWWLGEMTANGALSDAVAARLALRTSSLDGSTSNLSTGGKDGRVGVAAGRGTVLWVPDGRTSVTASGFSDQTRTTAPRFVWLQNPNFPQVALDPSTVSDWHDTGGSLRVEHDFDDFRLTSLTSYQRSTTLQQFDLTDGLIYSALSRRPVSDFGRPRADYTEIRFGESTFQQEVRLDSPDDGAVAWTAGINYFGSDFSSDATGVASQLAFNFVSTQNGTQRNRIKTGSASVFGEATWPLTQRLQAITGLRVTREDKEARYAFDGNGNRAVVRRFRQDGSMKDTFVTGRTGLSFDWSDTLMAYATLSRGQTSSGYPALSVNAPGGKPEAAFAASTSWTGEAGFKSGWLDHRLDIAGAVFHNDVKNGHLIAFFPANGVFRPASLDYRSGGAELELSGKVSRNLRLSGGLGYTLGELKSVPFGDATGARSGNCLPNVARLNGHLGVHAEASADLLGLPGSLQADAVWQYVGVRSVDVRHSFELPAYGVVNLRIGWTHRDWTVYGFAENLFDRAYLVAGQSWSPVVGSVRVGQPRVVGIGVTVRL